MSAPVPDIPKNLSIVEKFAKWTKDNSDSSQCFYVKCKVESVNAATDQDGRRFFNYEVVCTAPDEFTPPSRFAFRSTSKVGQKDDILSCVLRARFWYGKAQRSKIPNDDGEYGTWRASNHAIEFVDYL